ncbi:hypothetical protein [Longimicrobium sp.]|uniref:hypothetical protein n=1 Tax=Longimicrobium sp. TaxID=2029185 RepID=UPI002B5984F1|nr:hypothetical protein [Longimicrobium sp.]HSU16213.1 hypothetical protein [Longimicrobium sp.]
MYCSTCGSRIADGRSTCQVCGAAAARAPLPSTTSQTYGGVPAYGGAPVQVCPNCGYRGMSAGYFSRGSHVAALVGLSLITAPIMAAGGIGYLALRFNHKVCPRCGMNWGAHGLRAITLLPGGSGLPAAPPVPSHEVALPIADSTWKRWLSYALLMLGALMLVVGLANGEPAPALFGLLFGGGGGMLLKGVKSDREKRRDAIIQSLQLPVLQLASRKGGRLTVTEVATEMGWPMARAEKVLNSLDDGMRVMSDITDEGVIVYDFLEIRTAQLPGMKTRQSALPA